jgi:thiol:disulfide interchange protein DsbD
MANTRIARLIFFSFFLFTGPAGALDSAQLLPQEQAYRFAANAESTQRALLSWDIAEGYYLYRNKFKFIAKTPGVSLGEPEFPAGQKKRDEFFGESEIYRGHIDVPLPLKIEDPAVKSVELEVASQGCADIGICYPPHKQTVVLDLPASVGRASSVDPLTRLTQAFKGVGTAAGKQDLLPPDQAFHFIAEVKDPSTLRVSWQIAEGYYLYRERFKFALPESTDVELGAYQIPHGKIKEEEQGPMEVFFHDVGFDLPLKRVATGAVPIRVQAKYQGCEEKQGVCYPPMEKIVTLDLPAVSAGVAVMVPAAQTAAPPGGGPGGTASDADSILLSCVATLASCTDRIADALRTGSTWLLVASFLGFGLLMAFSPCIFPMIPILSGLIVGHGHRITTGRAFLLSLIYVLASAATYTVFGVLAGVFGGNLQAVFQQSWLIAAFSAVFVLLALSMFGFYELQIPAFIQTRVAALSQKQRGGTLLGAAVMGSLSALIVGPCMAAPLAGALIYIGQTGDALLGGMALFALGLGMGIPLLIVGASAGKLLPRAGVWMNAVKSAFGVGLLAVAVWLLDRILPEAVTLFLWALLLIIPAIYLGALDALPQSASGWRKLWKGVGVVMLAYGILLLIGVATGSGDPLQPLRGVAIAGAKESPQPLSFRRVKSVDDLQQQLAGAQAEGRSVLVDFYADWCVSCKEMERYTFADPRVRASLADFLLLQADVTDNSTEDKALLDRFGLIGPPATLFFGADGQERKDFRVIGYMNAEDFLNHLQHFRL